MEVVRMDDKVDQKTTKQVKLDAGWHRQFKIASAMSGVSIKELMEACFTVAQQEVWRDYGVKGGVVNE